MTKKISIAIIIAVVIVTISYAFYYQRQEINQLRTDLNKTAQETVIDSLAWKVLLSTFAPDQQNAFKTEVQTELTNLTK